MNSLPSHPLCLSGELEIALLSMFEPYYRWPIEAAIGNSVRKLKAMAEHSG